MMPQRINERAKEVTNELEDLFCFKQSRAHSESERILRKEFEAIFVAGMNAYAWWEDGTEMVGTCGTTFAEAKEEVHNTVWKEIAE